LNARTSPKLTDKGEIIPQINGAPQSSPERRDGDDLERNNATVFIQLDVTIIVFRGETVILWMAWNNRAFFKYVITMNTDLDRIGFNLRPSVTIVSDKHIATNRNRVLPEQCHLK
jgi:alanine racemase